MQRRRCTRRRDTHRLLYPNQHRERSIESNILRHTDQIVLRSRIHDHRRGASSGDAAINDCNRIRCQPLFPVFTGRSFNSSLKAMLNNIEDEWTCGHVDTRIEMQIDGHCFTVDVSIQSGEVNAQSIWHLPQPARQIIGDTLHGHDEVGTGPGLLPINLCSVQSVTLCCGSG